MARKQCHCLLFALFTVVLLTAAFFVNSPTPVQAAPTASDSMEIQVDHTVQIRNGGLLVINDTVKLHAKNGELELDDFTLGFPFIYRSNLTYAYAYDSSNRQLDVKLDVGLGKIGFYGVEIDFTPSIRVSGEEHYEFTVVFVFSNLISSTIIGDAVTTFNATFPAYPSLIQTASSVNLTINLPTNVRFTHSSFEEENIEFTNRTSGAFQILNYTENSVEPFAYKPFWLTYEGNGQNFLIIEAENIKRDITVDSWKHVLISDSYDIVPRAGDLTEFKIQLKNDAFGISAWDEFGNAFKAENLEIEHGNATTLTSVTLTFSSPGRKNEPLKFKLTYQVLWENIVSQSDWQKYRIALSSFENFNWMIRKLVVTLTLPEGAKFKSTCQPDLGVVQKGAFQETLTLVYYNVTPYQNLSQEAAYEYNIFWASFRPTLWAGTAAAILSILALLWRAPRPAPPIPTIPVKREELKGYVDAYEQKRRSLSELDMLEEKTRKRKIPRRRYKVRKRALESRLSVLSKDLARLRGKLQGASPKYADMMRHIEIAEAEMEGIEAGIRRTETRYRRGEISIAAYHKLLEGYYRRRERARTTIDGILIRIKEEIT